MIFRDWVKWRMAHLGIKNITALAEHVGITTRTLGLLLKDPKRASDPNINLWLARTRQVSVADVEAARAGRGRRLNADERVGWTFYDANRGFAGYRRGPRVPGVPADLLARFQAVFGPVRPGGPDGQGPIATAMETLLRVIDARSGPTVLTPARKPAKRRA